MIMAGTTGLEPAASAVTDGRSGAGARRINRLGLRLSATVGFIGLGRLVFVQRFVQRFCRLIRWPLKTSPKSALVVNLKTRSTRKKNARSWSGSATVASFPRKPAPSDKGVAQ